MQELYMYHAGNVTCWVLRVSLGLILSLSLQGFLFMTYQTKRQAVSSREEAHEN